MNRKFLCVLFSLFVALNIFAETFIVNGLNYEIISETDKTVKVVAQIVGAGNYSNLEKCEIPSSVNHNGMQYSVTVIAFNAFNQAENLISVTIPATIVSMEENYGYYGESNAFHNTPKLREIIVNQGNQHYVSKDGVLLNHAETFLIAYPASKSDVIYSVPETVEALGTYAFEGCLSLREIFLPSALKVMGYYAFYNCTALEKLVCYAQVPPTKKVLPWQIGDEHHNATKVTLYTPFETMGEYQNAELWNGNVFPFKSRCSLAVLEETNAQIKDKLESLDQQTIDMVELRRSFAADGAWYTLCLPFDLSEKQIAESLGDCALMQLEYADKCSEQLLYIHFASASTITANTPYLFKPANSLTPPIFRGVAIKYQSDTKPTITTPDKLVSMTGIYAPAQVPGDSWYLGPDNTLYQPQGNVISNGFRAYFTLPSSLNNTQGLRARVVMDGETPTDINDIQIITAENPQKVFENGRIFILRGGHKYNLQGQVVE